MTRSTRNSKQCPATTTSAPLQPLCPVRRQPQSVQVSGSTKQAHSRSAAALESSSSRNRYAELMAVDAKHGSPTKSTNFKGSKTASSREAKAGRRTVVLKKKEREMDKPKRSEKRTRWRPTQPPAVTEVKRIDSMSSISSSSGDEGCTEDVKPLNWQQQSLLSRRHSFCREPMPGWANEKTSGPALEKRKKNMHRRCGSVEETKRPSDTLLPPLRYSVDDQSVTSKSAWRLVFEDLPKGAQKTNSDITKAKTGVDWAATRRRSTTDMPPWYAPNRKDGKIVVKLGRGAGESFSSGKTSSFSALPARADLQPSSQSTQSPEASVAEVLDAASPSVGIGEGLASIYAGPTFSAAAPEPTTLPTPRFATRKSRPVLTF